MKLGQGYRYHSHTQIIKTIFFEYMEPFDIVYRPQLQKIIFSNFLKLFIIFCTRK